jgi:Cof subfamily protein (haloacid dehalogenase superfamily)
MNRKTIFFDIDGTLLGTRDGKLFQAPKSTFLALDKLKRSGHRIAVCSGRQDKFIRHFFPGVFDSFVASNGAQVVVDGKTVRDRMFPEEQIRSLMARFDAYGCRYFFVGKDHAWGRGMDSLPQETEEELRQSYFFPGFMVMDWKPGDVSANMMDFIFLSDAEYESQRGAFSDGMVLNRHPGQASADLSVEGNNKADGIRSFLEYAGIPREDAVAFGDGYNDIAMMKAVGCGVAMGNAVDEVKRAADYVTADLFDGGISLGLEHLGLI